jgi:hypothetical protein
MYTEVAKFEFDSSLPQSARLTVLTALAASLEAVPSPLATDSPGFSLEIDARGRTKLTLWQPSKANTLWSALRAAQDAGKIQVTSPKHF